MKTTIYMIRHAESPFMIGQERSRGLSEHGKKDADKVKDIMQNKRIDVVVSSPYLRAIQTVQGIANSNSLTIQEYEELRERPIKGLEYILSEKELLEAIKKSFEDMHFCLQGGETTSQAQKRAIPIIRTLLEKYKGKNIVIGTHGNIMTIIMNFFQKKYGYDFWINTSKPDIYQLVFDDEQLIDVNRLWGG